MTCPLYNKERMLFVMKKALAILFLTVLVLSIPITSFASGVSMDFAVYEEDDWSIRKVSTKTLSFRCLVKNANPSKSVKSYEVTYYTHDEYGSQNGPTTTDTLKQDIRAYETIMSPEVFLKNATIKNVWGVYIAITAVRYSDGTYEYESNPTYTHFSWTWR